MNVSKQGGRYVVAKAITGKITEIREFWSAGEHVVVIKTEPAEAGVVAKKLDNMEYRGHLGSVAGDDTLFVVCQTAEHKQKRPTRFIKISLHPLILQNRVFGGIG